MSSTRLVEVRLASTTGSGREPPRWPVPEPTSTTDVLPEYFASEPPTLSVRSLVVMVTGTA
jgi:hypothetical protein